MIDWTAIISAMIGALPAAVFGLLAWRAGRGAEQKVEKVGNTVDGRMEELLRVTRENSERKGKEGEREAQAGREADKVGALLVQEKAIREGIEAGKKS